MKRGLLVLGAGLSLAVGSACGGNVVVDGASGGRAASSVSSSSSSSSTASSSCGAMTVPLTSSSSGSPCAGDSFVRVELCMAGELVDATFRSGCASSFDPTMWPEALGYIVEPELPPAGVSGNNLDIDGCVTNGAGSQGVTLIGIDVAGPGPVSLLDFAYEDGAGHTWTATEASMMLTVQTLGPVGDAIQGGFQGNIFTGDDPTPVPIAGTFDVCHTTDAK